MTRQRPINLNLFTIRLPIPAIVSILHRITGFILFLFIPLMLWTLSFSLTDQGFATLERGLGNRYIHILIWIALIPYCFHLVAGVRHLFSDFHVGESLRGGRISSFVTFIVSFFLIILVGVWLW